MATGSFFTCAVSSERSKCSLLFPERKPQLPAISSIAACRQIAAKVNALGAFDAVMHNAGAAPDHGRGRACRAASACVALARSR
jgi:hypothetical protein